MDYLTWLVVVCIRLCVAYAPVEVASIGSGMLTPHLLIRLIYDRQPGFGECPKLPRIHPPSLFEQSGNED